MTTPDKPTREALIEQIERTVQSRETISLDRMVEATKDALAALVAAHSLLSRSPKKAAPSDKMFDIMLSDYAAAIERTRAALTSTEDMTTPDKPAREALIEQIERTVQSRETISLDSYGARKALRLLEQRDKLLEQAIAALRTPAEQTEAVAYLEREPGGETYMHLPDTDGEAQRATRLSQKRLPTPSEESD